MKVIPLDIEFTFNNKTDRLHPVILHHNAEMILVDGGYEGFLPLLEKSAERNTEGERVSVWL